MKKILPLIFTLPIIFNVAGCNNTVPINGDAASQSYDVSKNNVTDKQNKSQIDNEMESATMKKKVDINIEINNTKFKATLEDNDTVKAFIKQLPLTVDMSELNGNEKYSYLSSSLSADKPSSPGRINVGDLMLYGDNCLVLFYKSFNTAYSYVKLGHIDNTTGIANELGSGNAKVTFSVSE